jgi:cysteine desulfurase/selenocysteine lyase
VTVGVNSGAAFNATIEALLTDESLRQREFPVARERIYLAHAAVCPLPTYVVQSITDYLGHVGRGGQFEYLHAAAETGARAIAAEMLGVSPDEIAFVPSTSAGLSLIAAGLEWKLGDNIVFAQGDFPSNVYPWTNLERTGVALRAIRSRGDGLVTLEDVVANVDNNTRLVALSSVHFATGARMNIDGIGEYLQSRGIMFCVDAIQSFGVLPLNARYVDFLTADAHKWMLGPQGMGILFVRRARFEALRPALVGWKSVSANKDFLNQRLEFAATARRYEPGSLNAIGLVGLHAALSMLRNVGISAIAERLKAMRTFLVPRLEAKGFEIAGAPDQSAPSGITSFRPTSIDKSGDQTTAIYKRLDQSGIVVSLREDPNGNKCIRVAPHFYTTDAELQTLLDRL